MPILYSERWPNYRRQYSLRGSNGSQRSAPSLRPLLLTDGLSSSWKQCQLIFLCFRHWRPRFRIPNQGAAGSRLLQEKKGPFFGQKYHSQYIRSLLSALTQWNMLIWDTDYLYPARQILSGRWGRSELGSSPYRRSLGPLSAGLAVGFPWVAANAFDVVSIEMSV